MTWIETQYFGDTNISHAMCLMNFNPGKVKQCQYQSRLCVRSRQDTLFCKIWFVVNQSFEKITG